MIKNLTDIPLKDSKSPEEMDKMLREHLGIGFSECAQALSESLMSRADELMVDMINLAPYGDYDKMTEDPIVILNFLKEEAAKPENWEIQFVEIKKTQDQLMELVFFNKAVDDGDLLKGFVFVGLSGKIRHAFAQIHS